MIESFSHADARRFVHDRYGERAGALSALSGGEWSRAYAFTLDGREAVIRFGAYRDDFAKDQLMAGHAGPALPIPAVWEIGQAPGGFFAVSHRAHGQMLDTLDSAGMRRILPAVFAALDALRDVDVSHTQGYGLWDGDGTGPHHTWAEALLAINADRERMPGRRAALETSPTGARVFTIAYETLRDLTTGLGEHRHVIHSDLLHHNVLVENTTITGVLD
jgi:hygromycin-B 4-O-kinase